MPKEGVSYVTMVLSYFKDKDPPVSAKDLQNYINSDPILKGLVTDGIPFYNIVLAYK